jgi:hypothetical protein
MARKSTPKDGIVRKETYLPEDVVNGIEKNIVAGNNTSFSDVNKNVLAALSRSNLPTYYKVLAMLSNPDEDTK